MCSCALYTIGRGQGRPPMSCKVKRESGAFLVVVSADPVVGGEPVPRPHLLAPLRLGSRRRLSLHSSPSPCFSPGFGTPCPPRQVKAARGATLNRCAQRLLLLAHRALVLALTGGVRSPLPEPGLPVLALLSLKHCLVDLVALGATPRPPLSSLTVGACHLV